MGEPPFSGGLDVGSETEPTGGYLRDPLFETLVDMIRPRNPSRMTGRGIGVCTQSVWSSWLRTLTVWPGLVPDKPPSRMSVVVPIAGHNLNADRPFHLQRQSAWTTAGCIASSTNAMIKNVCYLTQDARRALDFPPRHAPPGHHRHRRLHHQHRRGRLKQVAVKVDNDPRRHPQTHRSRNRRPPRRTRPTRRRPTPPNPTSPTATTRPAPIALQMERLITDIGQYGNHDRGRPPPPSTTPSTPTPSTATASARCTPTTRPPWDSQGPRLPLRLPAHDQRPPTNAPSFEADVAAVAEALPALDPALRKVMAGFFELVGHQIDESRTHPAALRPTRQTLHRLRHHGAEVAGVARQLNEAIGAAPCPCSSRRSPTPRLDIGRFRLPRHAH